MKKETIIAIAFGIFVGSVLGIFLLWQNRIRELSGNKVIQQTTKAKAVNVNEDLNSKLLLVSQPVDGDIVSSNNISIKGSALVNSLIVIQSPIKELIFKNDKQEFQVNFPLALGENDITVASYTKDKHVRSQDLTLKIYYLTN